MVKVTRSAKQVNAWTLAVGIDVSKAFHVAAARTSGGLEVAARQFANNRSGFEQMRAFIEEAMQQTSCIAARVGLESTGHYGVPLIEYLHAQGYKVVIVNAAHTCRLKELDDNAPQKNDSKDARLIAGLVAEGRCLSAMLARGVFAELRLLGAHREDLVHDRTRTLNRLHRYVDQSFPEFGEIFPELSRRGPRALLKSAPTPSAIIERGAAHLGRILTKASMMSRVAGRKKAESLVAKARETIGGREGSKAMERAITYWLERLDDVERELAAVDEEIKACVKSIDYGERIARVPVLGRVTVGIVLGQTGDLRQYRRSEEVIKVAGLNLCASSSGASTGRPKISRRGRPLLRRILYMAALRSVTGIGTLRTWYAAFCKRRDGKEKTKALIGGCRKLLRILFAMVRDNAEYRAVA